MCRTAPDELWMTWVPQLSVVEPIVWHGLVSIALHHKLYLQRFNPVPDAAANQSLSVSALTEYNAALRCLSEFPKQPKHLYLQVLSCISFLTIEVGCPFIRILAFGAKLTTEGSCCAASSTRLRT